MMGDQRPIRLVTGSRLHFGLLSWGKDLPRRFGGLGLMIDRPGLVARIEPGSGVVSGPASDRARTLVDRLVAEIPELPPFDLTIEQAPPEHVGLGTGTQLSLGIARLLLEFAGRTDTDAESLARLTGRGRRSGVGLHGFDRGGLIVDGGRKNEVDPPPLISRLEFPEDWAVVLVIPDAEPGLHGEAERTAFAELPPCPCETSDRLCRLILLELLPAAAERDLEAFGTALEEVQRRVGAAFAPAQGAAFAHPRFDRIAQAMRDAGLVGIGQSSWGPTIYGFGRKSEVGDGEHPRRALGSIAARVITTAPRNVGATLVRVERPEA